VPGGTPERVTFTGNAFNGFESPDGARLVYQERFPPPGLTFDESGPTRVLVQPLRGGNAVELVNCAVAGSLSSGPREFYYADCSEVVTARAPNIDSGGNRFLADLEAFSGSSIAVRANGEEDAEILYVRSYYAGVDLFLVENFK
jgi:hypothetical protein